MVVAVGEEDRGQQESADAAETLKQPVEARLSSVDAIGVDCPCDEHPEGTHYEGTPQHHEAQGGQLHKVSSPFKQGLAEWK